MSLAILPWFHIERASYTVPCQLLLVNSVLLLQVMIWPLFWSCLLASEVGFIFQWLFLTKTACAPTLPSPLHMFAWEASVNTTMDHVLQSPRFGKDTFTVSLFSLTMTFTALIRSPTLAHWNLVLKSTTSKATSGLVPWTAQLTQPTSPLNNVCSADVTASCLLHTCWQCTTSSKPCTVILIQFNTLITLSHLKTHISKISNLKLTSQKTISQFSHDMLIKLTFSRMQKIINMTCHDPHQATILTEIEQCWIKPRLLATHFFHSFNHTEIEFSWSII